MPESADRIVGLALLDMAGGLTDLAKRLETAAQQLLRSSPLMSLILPGLSSEELQLIASRALPGVALSRQVDVLLDDEELRIIANVLALTGTEFDASVENLLGPSRAYTRKRQYAMWVITQRCMPQTWLLSDAARLFGCDHGQLGAARKLVNRLVGEDTELAGALDNLFARARDAARRKPAGETA